MTYSVSSCDRLLLPIIIAFSCWVASWPSFTISWYVSPSFLDLSYLVLIALHYVVVGWWPLLWHNHCLRRNVVSDAAIVSETVSLFHKLPFHYEITPDDSQLFSEVIKALTAHSQSEPALGWSGHFMHICASPHLSVFACCTAGQMVASFFFNSISNLWVGNPFRKFDFVQLFKYVLCRTLFKVWNAAQWLNMWSR